MGWKKKLNAIDTYARWKPKDNLLLCLSFAEMAALTLNRASWCSAISADVYRPLLTHCGVDVSVSDRATVSVILSVLIDAIWTKSTMYLLVQSMKIHLESNRNRDENQFNTAHSEDIRQVILLLY